MSAAPPAGQAFPSDWATYTNWTHSATWALASLATPPPRPPPRPPPLALGPLHQSGRSGPLTHMDRLCPARTLHPQVAAPHSPGLHSVLARPSAPTRTVRPLDRTGRLRWPRRCIHRSRLLAHLGCSRISLLLAQLGMTTGRVRTR